MTDFIEEYKHSISALECQSIVGEFNYLNDLGFGIDRQSGENALKATKDDTSMTYSDLLVSQLATAGQDMMSVVNSKVLEYIEKYRVGMFSNSMTRSPYPIGSESVKIQKTSPGQGFHVWHCENNCGQLNSRFIAWTLYLNDVEEGGETEFIYQHKRVKPEAGKLVIWPAGFTHTHRGNPPLKGDKYIATGWYRYTN